MKNPRGIAPSIQKISLPGCDQEAGLGSHELLELISLQRVFDIYIPEAIYQLNATTQFIRRLGALSEGATLYRGVEGDWYHETESVRVLRMSITTVSPDGTVLWTEESIREAISKMVCEYMIELREGHGHFEEAIFFNDWQATGTVVKALVRQPE